MKIIENFDETYDGGTGNLLSRKRNDSLQESFGYDNLERLLSVVDENGTKVFDASYDAWGKQVVTLNTIGLHRGYTGHEMLSEFDIINMNQRSLSRSGESNGRLYDPVLGRFFSPDNYVQMPDNSQSFNRYSYCLNNPLKYMDPSGNLFGIDDAIIAFAAFNMASSMMQAAFEGKSVWKAGALSLLSSGASYGIGELFKGTAATFGNELLRAGAHGLASGVISALDGDNFASAFVSGAAASGMGSYAQSVDMNLGLMVASTTAMGGVVAWMTGNDFLQGAMEGINIGLLNDVAHDGNNDNLMGGVAICEVLPDGTYVAPEDIPCVIVRMVGKIQFSTPAPPIEKPLESVHPEFEILFVGRAAVLGTFESLSTMLKQETGGLKQWVKIGMSYSKEGGFDTKSIRWGASPHYAEKIGNTTLRRINQGLRNKRIPIDNWRTADTGHLHFKWGDRNTNQWFYIRK